MSASLTHALRSGRTLIAHELREQVPIAAVVITLAYVIVHFVHFHCSNQLGELEVPSPMLVPAVLVLLMAFASAELFSRDQRSGLSRVLAAAPVGPARVLAPRLVVLAVVAALLGLVVIRLELIPSSNPEHRRSLDVLTIASTAAFTAIVGSAMRHGLGAAAIGAVFGLAVVGLRAVAHLQPASELEALLVIAAEHFRAGSRTWWAPLFLIVALCVVSSPRGIRRRSRAYLSLGALMLVVAPGMLSASHAIVGLVRVPFEAASGRVVWVHPSPSGAHALVHVSQTRWLGRASQRKPWHWSSVWSVDTTTGQRERLPSTAAYYDRWIDAETCVYCKVGSGRRAEHFALDVLTGDMRSLAAGAPWPSRPAVSATLVVDEGGQAPNRSRMYSVVVPLTDGTELAPIQALAWQDVHDTRTHLLDPSGAVIEVSRVDGTRRQICEVTLGGTSHRIRVSPDGRWLCLQERRPRDVDAGPETTSFVRLVDLTTGLSVIDVEGMFEGWSVRAAPLIVRHISRDPAGAVVLGLASVGPSGVHALTFARDAQSVMDLDGSRWLVHSRNEALDVYTTDGDHQMSLRQGTGEER